MIDTASAGMQLIAEPGKQETVLSQVFDAPRELVFRCYTEPEHIVRWWGPRYLTTVVDVLESRPGGRWRFVQHAPDGAEHAFHGVFHRIDAPEQLVYTFEYEGAPGHVVMDTVTFEDLGADRTRVTVTAVFQRLADRDEMLKSGMEFGAREGWERLAELLAELS